MNIDNIRNINFEEEIKKSIDKTKEELKGLTIVQTCKIYSSYLYRNLRNNHLCPKLCNTQDFNISYEHYFIIVNDSYLIDMNYQMFNSLELDKLFKNYYFKLSKDSLNIYLSIIEGRCKSWQEEEKRNI